MENHNRSWVSTSTFAIKQFHICWLLIFFVVSVIVCNGNATGQELPEATNPEFIKGLNELWEIREETHQLIVEKIRNGDYLEPGGDYVLFEDMDNYLKRVRSLCAQYVPEEFLIGETREAGTIDYEYFLGDARGIIIYLKKREPSTVNDWIEPALLNRPYEECVGEMRYRQSIYNEIYLDSESSDEAAPDKANYIAINETAIDVFWMGGTPGIDGLVTGSDCKKDITELQDAVFNSLAAFQKAQAVFQQVLQLSIENGIKQSIRINKDGRTRVVTFDEAYEELRRNFYDLRLDLNTFNNAYHNQECGDNKIDLPLIEEGKPEKFEASDKDKTPEVGMSGVRSGYDEASGQPVKWVPDFNCPMAQVPIVQAREKTSCDNVVCDLKAQRVAHGNELVRKWAGEVNTIIDQYNEVCMSEKSRCEAERDPECNDGKKIELFTVFSGDYSGKLEGAELLSVPSQDQFKDVDELVALIEGELRKPIDRNGVCRDCLDYLRIIQHGGKGDSLAGEYRIGEIILSTKEDVDQSTMLLKSKTARQKDAQASLLRIRKYLCKSANIVFTQCNVATGEKGRITGTALANFFGVPVLAPDFSSRFGFCGGSPTAEDTWGSIYDWAKIYRVFRPAARYELSDDCELRQMALQEEFHKRMIEASQNYNSAVANLPYLTKELLACEMKHCSDQNDQQASAYQQTNIAPESCINVSDLSTPTPMPLNDLPSVCRGSKLDEWLKKECESGCDDVAVQTGQAGAPPCKGAGFPIDGKWSAWAQRQCAKDLPKNKNVEQGAMRSSQKPQLKAPNDAFYKAVNSIKAGVEDQWGLLRIAKTSGKEMQTFWPPDASATIVAVIDSGVDALHPDLAGQIWQNTKEIPDNGIDDDGNGLVDDVNGWNFVSDNNDISDFNGHGTMVAGIIGATTNNGIGIAGINPWARILPVKVTNYVGQGNSVDLAAAVSYAARMGARVINISLGGDQFSAAEEAAVRFATEMGALIVVAAGNQSIDAGAFWPAGLKGVITVAAIDIGDVRAPYSNWGQAIDITAPGSDILSLRARYTDMMFFADENYTLDSNIIGTEKYLYHASGTSFAAPFVSGIASLLFSVKPELTAAEVRRMILQSAQDIETPGADPLTGYGLLDANGALAADPDFFINASIADVKVVQKSGKIFIQLIGTADANKFKQAEMKIGKGENPKSWESLGKKLDKPVQMGVLAEFDAAVLQQSSRWTLRLIVKDRGGRERETRFDLAL